MQAAIRKAAILVSALDQPGADAMLAQLDPQTAAQIRRAARRLGRVDPAEQQAVLAEFLSAEKPHPAEPAASEPAERLAAAGADEVVLEHADRPPAPRRPFQFLETVDSAQLANRMLHEHPQTVAIVAAHAPRRLAADLLRRLPEPMRSDVLVRMIEWQGTDSQALSELEQALEMSLTANSQTPSSAVGLAAVREILASAESRERGELLESLQRRDQKKAAILDSSFADAPPPNPSADPRGEILPFPTWPADEAAFVEDEAASPALKVVAGDDQRADGEDEPGIQFAELLRLDDRALLRVLAAADPQVTLLALTGASPGLVARVLRRLPRAEARLLQRRMASQGAFPLSDIELSQRELARVAVRLAAENKIRLPSRRQAA
jgi:flagellar motor switch protein FliG